MSVALSNSDVESNKDAYDAEFDGAEADTRGDGDSRGPSELCVDKETSCIYTN